MRTLCGCLVVLGLVLAGCGESKEETAQNSVCDARASIQKQVQELDGLTASTVTLDGVKSSLQSIGDDLTKIKDAQGDLSGDRKDQAEQAWQSFRTEVKDIRQNLLTSLSAADAKQQLAASFDSLAASFRSAFAPVDCS
jgi:phosphoglycerate-specific signal transduction histidine kinase